MTKPFICDRMSRSWGGGSVERVLEMASGQVRLGARSTPGGKGGSPLICGGGGKMGSCTAPFRGGGGCGIYPAGAASSSPPSCEKSTRSIRPMIS